MQSLLWNKVLRHVARRERSEKEVREYIQKIITNYKLRITNGQEEIIQKLKQQDFLNEERFVKAYIHDSIELQNKGKHRIKFELEKRGIDENIIDKYLSKIEEGDELEKALEFAKRRYEFMKKLPVLTQKRRLYGLLVRRGFSPEIALDTIDKIVQKR